MKWASSIVVADFMVDGMNEATISRKLIKVEYMRLERYPRSEPNQSDVIIQSKIYSPGPVLGTPHFERPIS